MDIIARIAERTTRRVVWQRVAIEVMSQSMPVLARSGKSVFTFRYGAGQRSRRRTSRESSRCPCSPAGSVASRWSFSAVTRS
ncbi:hypothetical protein GCM10009625_39090 [Brachybacterium fresconis]